YFSKPECARRKVSRVRGEGFRNYLATNRRRVIRPRWWIGRSAGDAKQWLIRRPNLRRARCRRQAADDCRLAACAPQRSALCNVSAATSIWVMAKAKSQTATANIHAVVG